MGRHVIVGAGTIGSALAARLAETGHEVISLSRSGGVRGIPGVTGVALDATDQNALERIAKDADVIYNCANPPYHRWAKDWPPIAAALLGAASSTGAVLVTLSNLYGYGPVSHAMAETDQLAATSTKGRVRAAMWNNAKDAHDAGRVRATEVRASDYFGPGITSTGILGDRVVPQVLDHDTVSLLGDLDAPHSWTYVDDVVRALEVVGGDARAWGKAWHAPTASPRSSREAVAAIADAAGLEAPSVRRVPWSVVRVAGIFAAPIRELHEIAYQFDAPFVVDSCAFAEIFGVRATDFDQACAETVAWWRRRRGFPLAPLAEATASS